MEQDKKSIEASARASRALLVLGMHRSGTSATTRVLNLLGADLGENLMGPGYSNDHGFWEHMEAFQINDRFLRSLGMTWNDPRRMPGGWEETAEFTSALREIVVLLEREFAEAPLWALKDPRICRLVPLWRMALENHKVAPHAVIVVRHPDEIAGSLAVRDGLSRSQVHLLWARHLCEAERQTRGMPRCVIRYDRMLKDWRSELSQAGSELGLEWPVTFELASAQIDGFLKTGSRHHVAQVTMDADMPWVDMAYRLFSAIPGTGDWTEASALVDDFERVIAVGDAYLDETRVQLDELTASRSRFENTEILVNTVQQMTMASLQESELRVQAGMAAQVAESEQRALSGVASLVAESDAKTAAELSASREAATGAIDSRTESVLTFLQDDARLRQEQQAGLLELITEKSERQAERNQALEEQVAQLSRLVGARSQELDALHSEITRLLVQLDSSRMEGQRQQHAYATACAELSERLEVASACASLQAALIWDREQDIAVLNNELESTKQNLDAAIRLADSLDGRLRHATRPWYKKLTPGRNINETREAS